ncbi:anthrone oxygenase family protein [Dactylosporangium sp. NPDC049525]|uniref:anthrone oxygenase family protein n=1 Tax=Dactylosporangium sp. NPDC049525 TaxID=3154730 RepID=UPI00343D3383
MALQVAQFVSIVLATLVAGMFFGPWLALHRSIATFEPEMFIALVRRLNRNMAPVMTALMPAALLAIGPVLLLAYGERPAVFLAALSALALFGVALLVTMRIEVPIVRRIETWTVATLPPDWQRLRDRWSAFHLVRIATAGAGLALLLGAAIF